MRRPKGANQNKCAGRKVQAEMRRPKHANQNDCAGRNVQVETCKPKRASQHKCASRNVQAEMHRPMCENIARFFPNIIQIFLCGVLCLGVGSLVTGGLRLFGRVSSYVPSDLRTAAARHSLVTSALRGRALRIVPETPNRHLNMQRRFEK